MTAPAIVVGSTKLEQVSNNTSHVINVPTNSSGDKIYIAGVVDAGVTVPPPAGFVALYDAVTIGASTAVGYVFSKTSGGSEGATYTLTLSPTERGAWIAWAVNNFGLVNAQGTNASGTSSTATVPAVVTTVNDCLRISVVLCDFGNDTSPHGTPSTHTTLDSAFATSGGALSVHYKTVATATTDPSQTVSLGASEEWVGITWAIAPPGGTTYNQAAAGTQTSAGALVRKTLKALAGAQSSAGALVRKCAKVLAGTQTSSGALRQAAAIAAVALSLAARSALTLPTRLRALTVAIRDTLTVKRKDR